MFACNDPDVFGLWPCSDIRELIKQNKAADLTDCKSDKKWEQSLIAIHGNIQW